MVFYEGLQGFALCGLIEKMLGRAAAETLIDAAANAHLAFDVYPKDSAFFEVFRKCALNLLQNGSYGSLRNDLLRLVIMRRKFCVL